MPNRVTAKHDDLLFMRELAEAFLSRQSNQFLITGNVLDCVRWPDAEPEADDGYLPLTDYLRRRLTRPGRLVVGYNLARGIEFASNDDRRRALDLYLTLFRLDERREALQAFGKITGESSSYVMPALILLQKLTMAASRAGGDASSVAIVFEHADSIVPDNALNQMGDADRQRLIFFKEWLTEPEFVDSNHLLLFIAETASGVNAAIRRLPHLINVRLPLPDHDERLAFIRWTLHRDPALKLKGSQTSFAELMAGMTLLGIEQTMRLARHRRGRLEPADVLGYLNRLLISSIGDHLEVVHPEHSLRDVIGASALKEQLERLRRLLASGRPDVMPVGLLVSGPNGVGKTFVINAWAAECNRLVIVLKNLRSSYFGETDQIFEKIRNVLEVLGNVIILIDEADTVFGKPGSGTHETEQRLFGNLIQMMGDPKNRGRIVWVLMTARPDNLAPDLKRSGRAGLHLPIFDPEGADREAFFAYLLASCGLQLSSFKGNEREQFQAQTERLSPADFRELRGELAAEAVLAGTDLTPADVLRVLRDYQPADIAAQRRRQILQAMLHCSKRSLIPPSLQDTGREAIHRELSDLRRRLDQP